MPPADTAERTTLVNPMDHTPDLRTDSPAEPAAARARSRQRAVLGDNPYLTVVHTGVLAWLAVLSIVMVVLLLFMLNGHSLSLLIVVCAIAAALLTVGGTLAATLLLLTLDDHSNRLDSLETTVANGFTAHNAKIAELDAAGSP